MRFTVVPLFITLFASCTSKQNTIKIKGSDTEVNLSVKMAESFHDADNKILVSVSGGGSGLGIASLINGTADIANSSRRINEEELTLFRKKNIALDSFIFAQDALAFVVHEDLPIDSIDTKDLAKILSGEEKNWSTLTGKKMPINIYGRQSNSGTHSFVKKVLKIDFSPYAKQMNGNAQILEALKVDESGIGYVGAGYVINGNGKGVKVLKITRNGSAAVSPLDIEKITSGEYFFQRPLFQYFKTSSSEKVKPFLDYEKTKQGLALIQASGYYLPQHN